MAWGTSFAQKNSKLSGKVVDEKNQTVAFAIVKLLNFPDTNVVKSVSTNPDGDFIIDPVKSGDYVLSVSMVGYKTKKTTKISINGNLNIPSIVIESTTKQLNEVSVQGKKPFIEHQIDKTVLNVENSIVASGGSVLDVLEKAPGVQIDRQSDQIKLNNKSGVMIMIDGKANYLSGADVTALLGNMSSDQISTIELITNPSSKYDAAGNAGIINIKLKRNKAYGTNGTVSANLGRGIIPNAPSDLYRGALNLNLNHREGKWNIFGNGNVNRKVNFNNTFLTRTTQSDGLASLLTQNFDRQNTGVAYLGKLGADYYASEKTVFGIMVDANTVSSKLSNLSNTNINEMKNGIANSSSIVQNANSEFPTSNITANFNIKHDYNKDGKSITFDADYSGFNNKKDENFLASYLDANGNPTNNTTLKNSTDAKINVYAAKTDLTLTDF